MPGPLACPSCRPGATQAQSRASRAHLVSDRNAFTWFKNGEGTKRSSSSSRRPQPLSCPPSASWPSTQVCFGSSCLGQVPGKPELCSDVPTSEVMSATESYLSDFQATRSHTDCQAHTLVHGRSPEHLGAGGDSRSGTARPPGLDSPICALICVQTGKDSGPGGLMLQARAGHLPGALHPCSPLLSHRLFQPSFLFW